MVLRRRKQKRPVLGGRAAVGSAGVTGVGSPLLADHPCACATATRWAVVMHVMMVTWRGLHEERNLDTRSARVNWQAARTCPTAAPRGLELARSGQRIAVQGGARQTG